MKLKDGGNKGDSSMRLFTLLNRIGTSMALLGLVVKGNIKENGDLNDYITPGTFFCGNSSIAATLGNCPYTAYGFKLTVRRAYGSLTSGYITQEIKSEARQNRYFRRRIPSGEWSEWQLTGGVDYVVEQGKSGSWYYRKWNNGTAECWMTWQGIVTPYETNSGITGLKNSFVKYWDLPFSFIERYMKEATVSVGNGMGVVASGGLNDTLSVVCLHWLSNITGTSTVNLYIIGKYK